MAPTMEIPGFLQMLAYRAEVEHNMLANCKIHEHFVPRKFLTRWYIGVLCHGLASQISDPLAMSNVLTSPSIALFPEVNFFSTFLAFLSSGCF